MNTRMLVNHQSGFKRNDTLASNLKFSGYIRVWEVSHSQKILHDGDTYEYWVIKDEYGARMSTSDKKLAESLVIAERYVVIGEIKIGKGGTYLNLKDAKILNGEDFKKV